MDAGPNDPAEYVRIVERIQRLIEVDENTGEGHWRTNPVLTLDEFFRGNREAGSIMPNLARTPSPTEVFSFLKDIEGRDEVDGVYVTVTQWDGEGRWPFSEVIIVVAKASISDIESWFPEYWMPDEIVTDPSEIGLATEYFKSPAGYQEFFLWYD